ncbi:MAG: aldehyde ferredoxin oxidoreductase family protein [Candidatus Bathyarchaeia archaeon]
MERGFRGYMGEILRIDLSRSKIKTQRVHEVFIKKYIGGRGWGARIVWDEIPKNVKPFDEENKLIIANGPLTGTMTIGSGKTSVCSISPLTNYYGDSNVGGMFGTELKQAGFDALILEGSSKKPVYLWINDGRVEFKDAQHLWGKGCFQTEGEIKRELGDSSVRVACIGQAGENLVKFASINCDFGRQAGRCGMGAILGVKKVKAIAVKGSLGVQPADPEEALKIFEEALDYILSHKDLKIWRRQGTMQVINWSNENSALPTKNFQFNSYEEFQKINGEALEDEVKIGNSSCFGCPICCGQLSMVKSSRIVVEGPEYETAGMLGSNCALNSIEDIAHANYICDDLGLDTISTGALVAFAMECFEKGILSQEDIGFKLDFGNKEGMFKLIEMIARREGIGNLLAEGVKKASEKLGKGSESYAMHVKGLEISAYEHRAAQAMALAYASCDIGAHHNRAWAITYDVKVGRESYGEDKVKWVIYLQHLRPMFDCLGVCRFPWVEFGLDPEYYARFFKAITGFNASLNDLLKASERVYNLTRIINVSRGMSSKEDWLPERDFKDPIPTGPFRGMMLDRRKFDEMIKTYYKIRGWNELGIPLKKTLIELELEDTIPRIEAFHKH